MNAGIETEVEGLQRLVRLQAATGEAAAQLLEVPPLHLIGEQYLQELAEAPFLPHGLGDASLQCLTDSGKLQPRELGLQRSPAHP